MTIIYDARGNEITGGLLDQITNGTVTDARTITTTLSSLNAEAVMDLNGQAVAMFDLRTGAGNLTVVFEATVDNANYAGLPGIDTQTEQLLSAVIITTTLAKTYIVGCSGYRRIRARIQAYTSGNVVVACRASRADYAIYSRPWPATLWVTATGAAAAAVTATLPAAGAGLFHYITEMELTQFVAVARTAAAVPVLATTTNLPGSPVISCDATVGAIGQIFRYQWEPASPIKSSVANTATTFVGPATTGTIWRWNIGYYVGA